MRGEYSTRQKRELLKFLKDHSMEHYSVDDVTLQLRQQGTQIGRTTVYRYLEALAEQGGVRKYQNAQGMIQYQFVEDESRCSGHFHMMCKKCGTLYHVDCSLIRAWTDHIAQEHGFMLDPKETILVGICAKCMDGEAKDDVAGHTEGCHHCV